MAMTIMEMLAEKYPNGRPAGLKKQKSVTIARLIQRHMSEIDEARNHGYSWKQITTACRELWEADKDAKGIIGSSHERLLQDTYHALKNGKISQSDLQVFPPQKVSYAKPVQKEQETENKAMMILDRLSEEQPRGAKYWCQNKSLQPMYRFVKRHMTEIEEAREHGYSWAQIEEVCRELWESSKDAKKIVWWKKTHLIENCYYALKKGMTTTHNRAKNKSKTTREYRIQVTAEE